MGDCGCILGPAATVLAAGAAVIVTWCLGQSQIRIAKSQAETAQAQRDIAFDKLKHDLFEKRYEVYLAAKGIMERVIRTGAEERPIDDHDLLNMRIKMDEGRFFFSPQSVVLFETIDRLTTQHEVARLRWKRENNNDAVRAAQGDLMADAVNKLLDIYSKFPVLMQEEMKFSQLTA